MKSDSERRRKRSFSLYQRPYRFLHLLLIFYFRLPFSILINLHEVCWLAGWVHLLVRTHQFTVVGIHHLFRYLLGFFHKHLTHVLSQVFLKNFIFQILTLIQRFFKLNHLLFLRLLLISFIRHLLIDFSCILVAFINRSCL